MASCTYDLCAEAKRLSPLLTEYQQMASAGILMPYDFVGCFILSYASIRRPIDKWSCGVLKPPIQPDLQTASSMRLSDLPSMVAVLHESHVKRLFKGIKAWEDITIMDIYNHIRLAGIKKNANNLVNRAFINWLEGKWPFLLLHHIPTPMAVMRMQANNQRVISLFYKEENLATKHEAMLTYMGGARIVAKDALDFLVHDITHMEHFMHPDSNLEQVGFMRSLLSLRNGSPRKYFEFLFPGDTCIWLELEYLISDMNCFLPHLFKYLLAKVSIACNRRVIQLCSNMLDLLPSEHGTEMITMIESGMLKRMVGHSARFVDYSAFLWHMLLHDLKFPACSKALGAGMYFFQKSHLCVPDDNTEGLGVDSCGSGDPPIDFPALLDEEGKRLASSSTACDCLDISETIEWNDVTAGETLRKYFSDAASST